MHSSGKGRPHLILAALALLAGAMLQGCSTTRGDESSLTGRVHAEALALEVADPRTSICRDHPALRWDDASRDLLASARSAGDVQTARAALDAAGAAAVDAARQEAMRLPASSVARVQPGGDREQLLGALAGEHARALAAEQDALAEAAQAGRLVRALSDLESSIEPSVKESGRAGRTMKSLFLAPANWIWLGWHVQHEYRGPNDVDFDKVTVYAPPRARPGASALERHAPWIVQDSPESPGYDVTADRVGTVGLGVGARGLEPVVVDVQHPSVYGYETHATLNGVRHDQLVYTWWYPEHPPGKEGDPEAGRIEGVTLRITLERAGRPAIYETVYNCGCYHRVYVDAAVEAEARAEHGDPLPGKRSAVETLTKRKIDLIVPELFRGLTRGAGGASQLDQDLGGVVSGSDAGGPAVHVYSRFHMIGAVRPAPVSGAVEGEVARVPYTLRPYEELELVPTADGYGSMFQANGLVRGAERREGFLLSGLGMLSAGQPRQRGTQMIHFDQYDFDDPHLLEEFLRLPSSF